MNHASNPTSNHTAASVPSRIPVILDTDIGNDNDDNFALACLLRSGEFDVKLITTTDGQQRFRGRILAKLLTAAGRTDIPIGLGAGTKSGAGHEMTWVEDFPLTKYTGKIEPDGVTAMIETIHASKQPITLIAIGPLQTVAAALEKDPSIAAKVNFVGMQGAVFKGYGGSDKVTPEFNVKLDIPAAKKVFAAPWKSTAITPLDTCGLKEISLTGERFAKLKASTDPLAQALVASYAAWAQKKIDELTETTTQYDAVAIYLAKPEHPLLVTQKLKIAVTDAGVTAVSSDGHEMNVATSWTNIEAYRDWFLGRILSK